MRVSAILLVVMVVALGATLAALFAWRIGRRVDPLLPSAASAATGIATLVRAQTSGEAEEALTFTAGASVMVALAGLVAAYLYRRSQ